MTNQVIEVVQFKLNKGVKDKEFLSANKDIEKFISSLKGFVSRRLAQKEGGVWIDVVEWKTMEDAKIAAEKFMYAKEVEKFIMMIDEKTIDMQHFTIQLTM